MIRVIASFLLAACLFVPAAGAAESPIAGTWNCVSKSETGQEIAWTLSVKAEEGKLSGEIVFQQTGDKIAILEPVLKGENFSFKVQINADETVELTSHIQGTKIEGSFKSKFSGTGAFHGNRQM